MDTLEFIFGGVRCNDIERLIRRSFGDKWWNWSDRGGRLRSGARVRADPQSIDLGEAAERDAVNVADGPTSAEREELGPSAP